MKNDHILCDRYFQLLSYVRNNDEIIHDATKAITDYQQIQFIKIYDELRCIFVKLISIETFSN